MAPVGARKGQLCHDGGKAELCTEPEKKTEKKLTVCCATSAYIPVRDLARVERFVDFWSSLETLPPWLRDVVMKLRLASATRGLAETLKL